MTGEKFEFQTSSKSGDGWFRFRWTLDGKKTGPPEHVHETERERFEIVTGELHIWLDDKHHALRAGDAITVERGVRHRFLNPGSEPVIVNVSLDGPRQEDALVPLAVRLGGSTKFRVRDFFTFVVHIDAIRASRSSSRIANATMAALAATFRVFGVRPMPRQPAW